MWIGARPRTQQNGGDADAEDGVQEVERCGADRANASEKVDPDEGGPQPGPPRGIEARRQQGPAWGAGGRQAAGGRVGWKPHAVGPWRMWP